MINFKYHIVSLVAVFMALAIGIALGAGLVGQGLNEQIILGAQQDRKEVQELRAQILQMEALDAYRDDYAQLSGAELSRELLSGNTVAVVAMPTAPNAAVDAMSGAVTDAGGELSAVVEIKDQVFDPESEAAVAEVVDPFGDTLDYPEGASLATKFGLVLARGIAATEPAPADEGATQAMEALADGGLVNTGSEHADDLRAQIVIVVGDQPAEPKPTPEALLAHVQMHVALRQTAPSVVLAGPNSQDVVGSDIATARNEDMSKDVISTVDVADLPSGVTTSLLAAKEQLLGRQGHYGAAASRDAIAPELPLQ